jgi:hypothetical protein
VKRRSLVLRSVYALCLLGATWNHTAILFRHGLFWDYAGVPLASAVFWTMLTVLDPAAVVLLFVRTNAGVTATIVIIVVDVVHNLWVQTLYARPLLDAVVTSPPLIEQILFMIFVLCTAPFAWRTRQGMAADS